MSNLSNTLMRYAALTGLLAGLALSPAQAGVIIDGTRQIYPEQNREITIKVSNDDQHLPRLVQVWLDDGDEKLSAEQSNAPFTLTPPIFRLEAGKSQTMRMAYTREPLPADKESLFWLNVLEVPPKPGADEAGEESNYLRFAFRLRTKVFFRPRHLAEKPEAAPSQLRWSFANTAQGSVLEVHNPSPYHVTFHEIALALGEQADAKLNVVDRKDMVAPGGSQRFVLQDKLASLPAGAQVQFKYINDYGGFSAAVRAPLQP